ncbi:MAG: alginate lyase family protein [Bacteroidetes bacterium]|nr:alginate lyase family protein [Bacteroidota bacterium]
MKLLRLLRTARHVHPDQIRLKMMYALRKAKAERGKLQLSDPGTLSISPIKLKKYLSLQPSCHGGTFNFLNHSIAFSIDPDWNFKDYGALWTIRLNSFEYLYHPETTQKEGNFLMSSFARKAESNQLLYDSYCVSQRIMNWTSFLSRYESNDLEILSFLWKQAYYLSVNPEYYLKNNHLLDNGFALLRAGLFFGEERFFLAGQSILINELNKQLLNDGAHIELSPMYHCSVLWRLLESIDAMQMVKQDYSPLNFLLRDAASKMFGWLEAIVFANGELPSINDSAIDGAPGLAALADYAHVLGIKCQHSTLGMSGLRKFKNRHFELLVDVNGFTQASAPGHAHADALHFILHVFGSAFIVDTGVSVYEKGPVRSYERSTAAHNTVEIGGKNQSEIYGNFRVGRRARIVHLQEKGHMIEATHDGYKSSGAMHTRKFEFHDNEIVITDHIRQEGTSNGIAFLHVDKKCGLRLENGRLFSKFVQVSFEGADHVECSDSWYSPAFGIQLPAYKVKIPFSKSLVTRISIGGTEDKEQKSGQ